MKKKLLMIFLMMFPFFINGCSCDKFDIDTYATAVRNYKHSTGIYYDLTIETHVEGENFYLLEEGTHKYIFTPSKKVVSFSSEITKYEVPVVNEGVGNNFEAVYNLKRYYVGETQKFYTNESSSVRDERQVEEITYEDKYDELSMYNVNNLVPVFEKEYVSNFKIEELDGDGNSKATFLAACPTYSDCNVNGVVSYTITMDENFYFKSIEFSVVNGEKTINYTYKFYKYNSKVEIQLPSDLETY